MTQNDFDFLDELDPKTLKNEKPKNKVDLWNYLDGYHFVEASEVNMAVNEFFEEECGVLNPSYWELMEYGVLASEYMKMRGLKFSC